MRTWPPSTNGAWYSSVIAQHIRSISDDALKIGEGSLYPALQRLLVNDWVVAEWGISEGNRKARIYKLTPAGRKLQARAVEIPGCIAAAMECPMPEIEALNKKLIDMRNALMRNAA